MSRLKALADGNLIVVQVVISVYKKVVNIVGKEGAENKHFVPFPQYFETP